MNKMATYIYNDKVMQGRTKRILKNAIFSLFTEQLGEEQGKCFKLEYTPMEDPEQLGTFVRTEI